MAAVEIFADADALASALADQLAAATRVLGAHVMLAGGRTPRAAYALVARGADAAHLWFSDERMVPADHADSNYGMVRDAWLTRVGYPAARVHRIAGERGAEVAAADASDELRALAGDAPGLDLVVLGVGADGHTASLFPGDAGATAPGLFVPARAGARVSAGLDLLRRARRVVVVATGAEKATMVGDLLAGRRPDLPAAMVLGPTATWLLDLQASRGLER